MEPRSLGPWLRQNLGSQLATVEKAVQRAKGEIDAQISSLKEVTADLSRKSEKDCTEKRNDRALYKSARAIGRMCQELQAYFSATALADPETFEGLKQFSDGVTKLASEAARIRDRWVGHIRPYYILDMMSVNASIEKLRRLGDQAWGIFGKEGDLLRRLEEIDDRVERMEELEQSLKKQLAEYDQLVVDKAQIEPQISEAHRVIESLANNPRLSELRKIDVRMNELRGDVLALGFRRLGRPLRKLEAMAGRGEYPIAPEVREKLSEYLRRPFTTFLHEGEGYPVLRSILTTLGEAVKQRKLLLKQREERKVLERINNITKKNVLDKIHLDATALLAERRKYLHDPDCVDLVRVYKNRKQELKALESKRADLEKRSKVLSEKVEMSRHFLTQFVKETGVLAEKLVKRQVKISLRTAGIAA